MYLDGWNWKDAQLKADDGIHLNWPSAYHTSGWWAQPGSTSKNKNYTYFYTYLLLKLIYIYQKLFINSSII